MSDGLHSALNIESRSQPPFFCITFHSGDSHFFVMTLHITDKGQHAISCNILLISHCVPWLLYVTAIVGWGECTRCMCGEWVLPLWDMILKHRIKFRWYFYLCVQIVAIQVHWLTLSGQNTHYLSKMLNGSQ